MFKKHCVIKSNFLSHKLFLPIKSEMTKPKSLKCGNFSFNFIKSHIHHVWNVLCRQFIATLQANKDQCDQVLEQVSQSLTFLEELKVKYVTVSRKTNALHEDCENLLEEQVRLCCIIKFNVNLLHVLINNKISFHYYWKKCASTNHVSLICIDASLGMFVNLQARLVSTAESINSKLAYFNELERISSVSNTIFSNVLENNFQLSWKSFMINLIFTLIYERERECFI